MKRLVFNNNSAQRLGITTNSFSSCLSSGEITLKEIIKWAFEMGFSWAEVRDPHMCMDREMLKDLKNTGDEVNMKLQYAWDNTDVLNTGDEIFMKGFENAAVFGEGSQCRISISPKLITDIEGKIGYTADEFEAIVSKIERYHKYASDNKIVESYENSFEPLKGDGKSYFGMSELLSRCSVLNTTFDPSNFTNRQNARVNPTHEELLNYYRAYYKQIPYCHLKMTKCNTLLPTVECSGDYNLKIFIEEFAKNPEMLLCLELPSQDRLDVIQENITKSIDFLINEGLASFI